MLIVYRTATGEIVDNHGTNSAWPEGPPDEMAYINTDAAGIDRTELSLLRLHDNADADLVVKALTHQTTVQNGELTVGDPRPVPQPVTPGPTTEERLAAMEDALDTIALDLLTGGPA